MAQNQHVPCKPTNETYSIPLFNSAVDVDVRIVFFIVTKTKVPLYLAPRSDVREFDSRRSSLFQIGVGG